MSKVIYKNTGLSIIAQDIFANIDTFEIALEGDDFHIPESKNAVLYDEKGQVKDSYENRVPIKGKNGSHTLNVRSMNSGRFLLIEGSPFAHRYGQNIFTSNDMPRACRLAINKTLKHFEIEVPDDLRKGWLAGDVDLLRVDLAVNFGLQSKAEVFAVLKQIRRQLIEQRGTTRTSGTTVYWAPRNGTEYSIALYAKGTQMKNSRKYDNLPERAELLKECESILRVEVRLRSSELRDLKLIKVSAWQRGTAEKVFMKYMARLKLISVTSGLVTDEELDDLPDGMRPVLALHKSGIDLSRVYSVRTCQRHSKFFREQGIDLRCPNQPEGTITSLTDYLSPEKVIKKAPAWMMDAGLVPLPLKRNAARRNDGKKKSAKLSSEKVSRGRVSVIVKPKRLHSEKPMPKGGTFELTDMD